MTMNADDKLTAYLQDRLEAEDRARFEADIAVSPALQAEIAALRAAAAALGAAPASADAQAEGWAHLSRSIDAERAPKPANDNRGFALLKVACIVVATIVVWQFGVAPQILDPRSDGFVPASETIAAPALRVAFAQDASLSDVTALLQEIGASVIDGPGAIGLYTLGFADQAAMEAAEGILSARADIVIAVSRP